MVLNLTAYRFVDLESLAELRARLLDAGRALGVRGTVLLADEGINLNICAAQQAALEFVELARRSLPGTHLPYRATWSRQAGFERFLVKVKREIITFGQPRLRPADARAPAVAPATLARWLDQGGDDDGRRLTLIDTRNRFEIGYGGFDGALDPGIDSFMRLPPRLGELRETIGAHRVVAYCTGGIRCEKAVAWMNANGFDNATQLDGGVLRYFDEIGARHWHGSLFVFDGREALTPALLPAAESIRDPSVAP